MAITYNTATARFEVAGRVGFVDLAKKIVDNTTGLMSTALNPLGPRNPLGPTESRYNPAVLHQNSAPHPITGAITPGQGTMRAHHIADHEIQQMVCDYMNGAITQLTFLDRMGALYFTSWIDVVVTPRIFAIWIQWAAALVESFVLTMSKISGLPHPKQAAIATHLTNMLSSSVANLRVGHGRTDQALNHAIAPRLQRGQFDLIGYFIGKANGHNFAMPSLSAETSLASVAWGGHFNGHPLVPGGGKVVINNVFVGPAPGGNIFISEQDPPPPALPTATSTVATATLQRYPGTGTNAGCYVLRGTRATVHLGVVLGLLVLLYSILGVRSEELAWPKDL